MILQTSTSVSLLLALAPTSTAQTTWIVDDNGAGDFVHIQDAVFAAQEGDVILVADGGYAGFDLDGKSLVIAAEPGAVVRVAAPVIVRALGAGQKVELEGLRMGETFVQGVATLRLQDNAGSVRIVDCAVFSGGYSYETSGIEEIAAVACIDSSDVGVLRSTIFGRDPVYTYPDPYSKAATPGLFARTTRLTITDSTFKGGDGIWPDGIASCGGPGASGAILRGSTTLECSDATFDAGIWGQSGPGCFIPLPPGIRIDDSVTAKWKASTDNGQDPSFPEAAFTVYCFGTWEECPCGNYGDARAGCEPSYGRGGLTLDASGTPRVSADTIVLTATGFNPSVAASALFLQGRAAVAGGTGAPFDDGLTCVGGNVVRLAGALAHGGALSIGHGAPGEPVSVAGAIHHLGGTRFYQVWYRSPAPQFCAGGRSNLSNGLEIVWRP